MKGGAGNPWDSASLSFPFWDAWAVLETAVTRLVLEVDGAHVDPE